MPSWNLALHVQDICAEDHTLCDGSGKEGPHERRSASCPRTGRLHIMKMLLLLKFIKLNTNKNPTRIFNKYRQDDSKMGTERQEELTQSWRRRIKSKELQYLF